MNSAIELKQAQELIRQLPSLQSLQDPVWQQAVQSSLLSKMPAGGTLNVCSDEVDAVGLLLQGSVKIRAHSEDGREFSIYRINPGEICMLSIAFMHASNRLHAEMSVEQDAVVMQIPQEQFEKLMAHSAAFRKYLMQIMSGYVVKLLDLIEEAHFDDLQTRILSHINELQRISGADVINTTHQQLANELGSSREVISRILKSLERQGALKLGRGTITRLKQRPQGGSPLPQRARATA